MGKRKGGTRQRYRRGRDYAKINPDVDVTAEEEYQRHLEELGRQCGAELVTGGHDPYATTCDLERGHAGPHEGPGWFGDGRERWEGGGYCAGDQLPVRNYEHVPAAE